MSRLFRSTAARLALLALLAPHISGCTVTQYIAVPPTPNVEKITGVTTLGNHDFPFDPAGAIISHDTLYARGKSGQIVIPMDSVKTVWVKQPSTGRTIGLVLGLAVVVVGFVIIANKTAGGSSSSY